MTIETNKIIFFVMLGLVFMFFFYFTGFFYLKTDHNSPSKKMIIVFISSVLFSLFFFGYTHLTNLFKKESFHFSPGAKICRGYPFMWQGSSEKAKYCQNLASTPEGKKEIDSYECGNGYNGLPGNSFEFTPMSNSMWKNEMCDS